MDLFWGQDREPENLLDYDGVVHYHGCVVDALAADDYYQQLLEYIQWQHDQAIIFGKTITTKRKVAWYADKPFTYTYSKVTKKALPWLPVLLELRELAQTLSGESYNSCLLNLYHDGSEGMAWHSDGEKDLKKHGAIASLSFGAARKFAFKHKQTADTKALVLEHGSLLVMKGQTQSHWLHRLPPTKKVNTPRVNLTFRTIDTV